MRYRDKQACQTGCGRDLAEVAVRLEALRMVIHQLRPDLRPQWERQLDDLRGRHNRGLARLEALRRAGPENWVAAARQTEEACSALREALARIDQALDRLPLAA